ncbi:pectinesterase family protein [Monoglobus pectinilyticus]|uniref:pectinesterase family protein n=1 Tax=Monoglobus pectinilyticus TaxID=1981510 RepID=UPI002E79EACA|nr:pectinesterase family protein [Monoglobus pectinilyticus]MEE0734423.1 pectinesterase family protein [Monoglobus pectinilyticus]
MRKLRSGISAILVIAMIMTTLGMATVVSAAEYQDTQGHWAESYINKWSDNGVIQGDGGYFRPDDAITRGEVAQVTQNLIGYVNKATNTFTDVAASDWYSDAILRLVEAGVLTGNGDGTMSPNNYMTREEAMTMLARGFGLQVQNSNAGITQYADYQNISDFATGYVGVMTSSGYIGGYEDGTIRPKDYISRAEFVKIIDNMIKLYITEAGTYGPEYVGGLIIIKTGGVTLSGIVAKGVVVSGQASGDVTITGSQISGNVVNLSANANVKSNTDNVVNPNDETKPNNTIIGGNGGSGSGSNGSPASTVTVKFYNGSSLYKSVSVTKNTYLSSAKRPADPTMDGKEFVGWYLSKEQADKADTISPFNFDTTKITKAMSFYAGYIESTKPTSTPTVTGSPAPTADPSKPTATAAPVPSATAAPVPTATALPVPTATTAPVPTATSEAVPTATPTQNPDVTYSVKVAEGITGGSLKIVKQAEPSKPTVEPTEPTDAPATAAETEELVDSLDGLKAGDKVTVKAVAESSAESIKVFTSPETTVTEVSGNQGYYTFEMPAADTIVNAQFGEAAATATPKPEPVSHKAVLNVEGGTGTLETSKAVTADSEAVLAEDSEYSAHIIKNVTEEGVHEWTFDNLTGNEITVGESFSNEGLTVFADSSNTIKIGLNFDMVMRGAGEINGDLSYRALKIVMPVTGRVTVEAFTMRTADEGSVYVRAGADGDDINVLTSTAEDGKNNVSGTTEGVIEAGTEVYIYAPIIPFNYVRVAVTPDGDIPAEPTATAGNVPTSEPSATAAPTEAPTAEPSATAGPTEAPTADPTAAPTLQPNEYEFLTGATVVVNTKPNNTGDVANITVTGKDGSNITVSNASFVMPDQDVTVSVVYSTPSEPTATPAEPSASPSVSTATPNPNLPNDIIWRVDDPEVSQALEAYSANNGAEAVAAGVAEVGPNQVFERNKNVKYTHTNGVEYNFTKSLKAGSGSQTNRYVKITPETSCTVTVVFDGNGGEGRTQYISQSGNVIGSAICDKGISTVTADVSKDDLSPVYTYGGGSNKNVYAVFIEYYDETPDKTITGNVTNSTGLDLSAAKIVFTNVNDNTDVVTVDYAETYQATLTKGETYSISVQGVDSVCPTTVSNTVTVNKNRYEQSHDIKFVKIEDVEVTGTLYTTFSDDMRNQNEVYTGSDAVKIAFTKQGEAAPYDEVTVNSDGTFVAKLLTNEVYDVTVVEGPSGYTLSNLSSTYSLPGGDENPFKNVLLIKNDVDVPYTDTLYVGADKEYKTVNEAVSAVRMMADKGDKPVTIVIDPGTYKGQVIIDQSNITLKSADESNRPIITSYYGIGYVYYSLNGGFYNADYAAAKISKGVASKWGPTLYITDKGSGFLAENIDFENTFNQYVTEEELADGVEMNEKMFERKAGVDVTTKNSTERAAAVATEGMNSEFYRCKIVSSQDTLYTGSTGYFKECEIYGNTDYIFGGNSVAFENCDLVWYGYSDVESGGHIAASKTSSVTDPGYFFNNCTIKKNSMPGMKFAKGDFGRNWGGANSAMFFNNTTLDGVEKPGSWATMGGELSLSRVFINYVHNAGETTDLTVGTDNPNGVAEKIPTVEDYVGDWTPVHYTK